MRHRAAARLYQQSCRPQLLDSLHRPTHTLLSLSSARSLHIQPPPTSTEASSAPLNISSTPSPSSSPTPDARFETLGPNSSLLHIHLSASQTLHTRRGTLAGFHGDPEAALSVLSILSPLQRLPLGIPFLYQRITATAPTTFLVSSASPTTSYAVLALDGRTDWQIVTRTGLAAWTGSALRVTPRVAASLSLAHWGQTYVTGRGLIALAARGSVFQVHIAAGESYVAHPASVLAYTATPRPPTAYRFKSHSSALRMQIPSFGTLLPNTELVRNMRASRWYQFLARAAFTVRTWARRTVWGDRLFLRFQGPATVLMQSGGNSIREVLSNRQIDEIADSEAGKVQTAVEMKKSVSSTSEVSAGGRTQSGNAGAEWSLARPATATKMSYASVQKDGKVKFEQ